FGPCHHGIQARQLLGRHFQEQPCVATMARSGLPFATGARDVLLPRIHPRPEQDAAHLLAAGRSAPLPARHVGHLRRGLLGSGRRAVRRAALPPPHARPGEATAAARRHRAARRRSRAIRERRPRARPEVLMRWLLAALMLLVAPLLSPGPA